MRVVGIVGTGRIGSALAAGLCTSTDPPDRVVVSPRNAQNARILAEQYPSVRVAADNDEVVRLSDVVLVALPPGATEDVLAGLSFATEHRVVSVVAMIPEARIQELVFPAQVARALPLPSISQRVGPLAVYPPLIWATALFEPLGNVVCVDTEAHLDALWGSTSVIAAQMEQIDVVAQVLTSADVPSRLADSYARNMLASVYAHAASSPSSLSSLIEESQTPGGLNEQVLGRLRRSGTFASLEGALNEVIDRVHPGRDPGGPPRG